jgi:hypothetical protein
MVPLITIPPIGVVVEVPIEDVTEVSTRRGQL